MKITTITVGKIKENYLNMALEEYAKRLSRYCKLEQIELADEKVPDHASDAQIRQIKEKEGERVMKALPMDCHKIALAIQGSAWSSEELADRMARLAVGGVSHIAFIIGGSLGLSDEVLRNADVLLSFSRMTFPHQLMRVILLEQIYRSYRIQNGHPYHH
jgi:23S rRNA (pseudouridine1915-N3)-methyltransferase